MIKRLWLSALLVTTSAGAFAFDCCPSNNQWTVTGEYLYFRPSVDDTYFVLDADATSTFPTGTRENNDPTFRSGYRVGGSYSFAENDSQVKFFYSHLGFSQAKTIAGDFLWATVGRADFASAFENYAGTASSDLEYLYQRYDAVLCQQVYNNCGLNIGLGFGVEAAEMKLNEDFTFVAAQSTGIIEQRSKSWGFGPQFGVELGYDLYAGDECSCLPGNLEFNFLTSGSILAAHTKTSAFNSVAGAAILDVSDHRTWRIIPALHTRLGFDYDMNFSCADLTIGIGYEFTSYFRGLARTSYPDDVADGLSVTNYYNFDMQGLYVNANVRF